MLPAVFGLSRGNARGNAEGNENLTRTMVGPTWSTPGFGLC